MHIDGVNMDDIRRLLNGGVAIEYSTRNLRGNIKKSHTKIGSDGKLNELDMLSMKIPSNKHTTHITDEKRENDKRRLTLNTGSFLNKVFEITASDTSEGRAKPNKPIMAPLIAKSWPAK
jgi:hypothetical protein